MILIIVLALIVAAVLGPNLIMAAIQLWYS
jgi:hypothetical protein